MEIVSKGYESRIKLSYTLTPEVDVYTTYGFLFYYRTTVHKARYNHVDVWGELIVRIDATEEINRLLEHYFNDATSRAAKKSDFVFDFRDSDGTVYHNCIIKSIEDYGINGAIKQYTMVFDWVKMDGSEFPSELSMIGTYKIPLNVTDNVLEYIKQMK